MATAVQIKLIHTLKGALCLDDDAYRAVLAGYGVESSKDLSDKKARLLVDDLEAKAINAGVWRQKRRDFRPDTNPDPMTRKIRALWAELHKAGKVELNNEKALSAYIKRMTCRDSIRWCSVAQKSVLIEAMKKWLKR